MEFNFSENLKKLRLSKKMTQEQVADFMNCSVQSVSRWECGTTFPDIMALPSLARLYSTTVDSLLGADFEKSKAELEDYYKQRQEYHHHGQCEKAYELTKKMYNKYPSEGNVQLFMVEDSFICYYLDDESEKKQRLRDTIRYAERHMNVTDDIERKCRYITYIARSYEELGEHENAVEWAKKLPSEWVTISHTMNFILDGDELVDNERNLIETTFYNLIMYMQFLADVEYRNDKTPYEYWDRANIIKKSIELIKLMFEDGDYGFSWVRLADAYRIIAAFYANCKMADETLEYLNLSLECSQKYDEYANLDKPYKHTSLLFKGYESDPSLCTKDYDCSHSELTYLKLTEQERYDFLRDDERFIELLQKCHGAAASRR